MSARQLVIGIAAASVEDAIAQGRAGLMLGCPSFLLAPPFYFKNPGDEGLFTEHAEVVPTHVGLASPVELGQVANDLALDLNSLYGTKEAGAYPLVLATYEIVCSAGYDAETAAAVKSFLTVAANDGQAGLSDAGYVPLPEQFKERLLTSIEAIGSTA